jgi:hypothetical protein
MAARGDASVALLKLDGRPIAAQVLLYQGRTAYTWKTSYDPEFGKYSPGSLLVDKVSMDLIDQGIVDAIDSCARGDGFMAQLWSARKPMVDMVASAAPGWSPGFVVVSSYFRAREGLKALRDSIRQHRRPVPAAAAAQVNVPAVPPAAAAPPPREASARRSRADRAA